MNPQNPSEKGSAFQDHDEEGIIIGGTENCPAEEMYKEYFNIMEVPENGTERNDILP